MILDGGVCKSGMESTIIGFENDTPVIYRLGSTSTEVIEEVVGKVYLKNNLAKLHKSQKEMPDAPGMLTRHYAPRTKTILSSNLKETISKHKGQQVGVLAFQNAVSNKGTNFQIVLSKTGNLTEAASKLYDALHKLDKQNLDLIIAEQLPNYGLGKSINDRLLRAAKS